MSPEQMFPEPGWIAIERHMLRQALADPAHEYHEGAMVFFDSYALANEGTQRFMRQLAPYAFIDGQPLRGVDGGHSENPELTTPATPKDQR